MIVVLLPDEVFPRITGGDHMFLVGDHVEEGVQFLPGRDIPGLSWGHGLIIAWRVVDCQVYS